MSESKQNNVKLYLSNKSAGSSKVYARVKTWRGDGPVSEGTSERRRLCPGLWAGARDIHGPDLGTDEKWQLWGHTTSVQLEEWRKGEDIRMKRGGGGIQGLTRLCGLHLETSLFGFSLFYLSLARVTDFTAGRLMLASCVVLFQHSRILFTWYLQKNRSLI